MCHAGHIHQAEAGLREALQLSRVLKNRLEEADNLREVAWLFHVRGAVAEAQVAYARAERFLPMDQRENLGCFLYALRAEFFIRIGDLDGAELDVNQAETMSACQKSAQNLIRVDRLQGIIARLRRNFTAADRSFADAVSRCRACDVKDEELLTLIGLAEVRHHQGRTDEARDLLDQIWEAAELGPYPMFHADGLNLLARIERDADHRHAAIAAATEAYHKAWCDGPPYAYHWGLQDARQLLAELGAPEPEMPPFDPSRYDPIILAAQERHREGTGVELC
jgi:hypothetical protein